MAGGAGGASGCCDGGGGCCCSSSAGGGGGGGGGGAIFSASSLAPSVETFPEGVFFASSGSDWASSSSMAVEKIGLRTFLSDSVLDVNENLTAALPARGPGLAPLPRIPVVGAGAGTGGACTAGGRGGGGFGGNGGVDGGSGGSGIVVSSLLLPESSESERTMTSPAG